MADPADAGDDPAARLARAEGEARRLRAELDEALSAAAVAECVKESMVELERRKGALEEEVATMRQLLNEAHDEASATRTGYEHSLARAKALVDQLEVENRELKINAKVAAGGAGASAIGAGDSVLDRDTILGGAAVISDATKSFARRMKSNLLQTGVVHTVASSPALSSGVARAPSPQESSLEEGMRKAHEDSELLKAIVVPLEEQIGALKDKLRETDAMLREHEERQSKTLLSVEGLAKWLDGKPLDEAMGGLLEASKSEDLSNGKDERSDGQESAYVALMSARYSLLVNELGSVRRENAEVMDLLDKERLIVGRMKREAVISNSEMLSKQREHLAEVARLHALLSEEQKEELLKRNSTSSDAKESVKLESMQASASSQDKSSLSSQSSSDSLHSKSHPSKADSEEDEGITRIVSAVEWESLQRELDKMRALLGVGAGDSVVGSDQYRALQAELFDLKKQKAQLSKSIDKMKEESRSEDGFRRELEDRWNERAEQHRTETEALNKQLQELESVLEQVRLSYTANYAGCRNDLKKLGGDREKIVRELKRLQDEVDILTAKRSATAEEMQNEAINLPEKVEDMQLLLLKLREDTIAAKVAKERSEEKARSEVAFLKTQLRSEEAAKASIEDQFTAEIDQLRGSLAKLQSCQKELQSEQQRRHQAEAREEEIRKVASATKREAEAAAAEKRAMEARTTELKNKLLILQQELDNSVAVQTDFVRLSQSLQVELEKIRQSEKEVRWQHEDDVDQCQACKTALGKAGSSSATSPSRRNRNKHHCRHCGRIFCSDCVSKTVASGPRRRQAKVCDVCHTLLVQDSAPYFSTDAPVQAN